MFPLVRNNGQALDAEYVRKRARWEPVVEATQIKGDSESHPLLSPTDEFADYEVYDFALERIYDIAVSDGRRIGADGRCRTTVGNTVDLETGNYTNDIGDAQLAVAWTDPDFDPTELSFYYVRALEIPTPRYSLLDAIALGIDWEDTNHPATIQERVYSSPIWYTP
jgi:hypothetical protein